MAVEKMTKQENENQGGISKSNEDVLSSDNELASVLESNDDLGFDFDKSGNPQMLMPGVIISQNADNHYEADKNAAIDVDFVEVKDENLVDYEGPLGKFKYDKTQFTLDTYELEAYDDGLGVYSSPATSIPRLHYIGTETDGNKICIPDGVKSGDFMFAESNIKNTPKLPKSLESTNSMFCDCKQLKTAISVIPSNVGNTAYMYQGCSNLKYGPKIIPSNVKDMEGMFGKCSKLMKQPYICDGVEQATFAFYDCLNLTSSPMLPKSVKAAYGAFTGTKYESADSCYVAQDISSETFANNKRLNEAMGIAGVGFNRGSNTSQNNTFYQTLQSKSSKDMIAEMFKIKFLQMQQKCSECLSRGVTYGKELAVKAKDKTVELAKAGATKVKTTYNEKVQLKMSETVSKAGATVKSSATGFADKVKTGTHDFVHTRYDNFMSKNAGVTPVNRGAQADAKFGGISPDSPDTSTEFNK